MSKLSEMARIALARVQLFELYSGDMTRSEAVREAARMKTEAEA